MPSSSKSRKDLLVKCLNNRKSESTSHARCSDHKKAINGRAVQVVEVMQWLEYLMPGIKGYEYKSGRMSDETVTSLWQNMSMRTFGNHKMFKRMMTFSNMLIEGHQIDFITSLGSFLWSFCVVGISFRGLLSIIFHIYSSNMNHVKLSEVRLFLNDVLLESEDDSKKKNIQVIFHVLLIQHFAVADKNFKLD